MATAELHEGRVTFRLLLGLALRYRPKYRNPDFFLGFLNLKKILRICGNSNQ